MRLTDVFRTYDPSPRKARPQSTRTRDNFGYGAAAGIAPLSPVVTTTPVILIKQGEPVPTDLGGYVVELPTSPKIVIVNP